MTETSCMNFSKLTTDLSARSFVVRARRGSLWHNVNGGVDGVGAWEAADEESYSSLQPAAQGRNVDSDCVYLPGSLYGGGGTDRGVDHQTEAKLGNISHTASTAGGKTVSANAPASWLEREQIVCTTFWAGAAMERIVGRMLCYD